ncbi:hypothetical protein [Bartonella rattaustraliani]|uniref:hypothetical protein n=1 Tax=Bartonella rattaustraliani TaxID=481139 RepID=UPI0002F05CDE|nr:hypothetical protein [Bartonella rattaustraliani]
MIGKLKSIFEYFFEVYILLVKTFPAHTQFNSNTQFSSHDMLEVLALALRHKLNHTSLSYRSRIMV